MLVGNRRVGSGIGAAVSWSAAEGQVRARVRRVMGRASSMVAPRTSPVVPPRAVRARRVVRRLMATARRTAAAVPASRCVVGDRSVRLSVSQRRAAASTATVVRAAVMGRTVAATVAPRPSGRADGDRGAAGPGEGQAAGGGGDEDGLPAEAGLDAGGEGGDVEEQDADDRDDAERADVALLHDPKHGLAIPPAAERVREVGQPVQVQRPESTTSTSTPSTAASKGASGRTS